jgi:hypothetical protein
MMTRRLILILSVYSLLIGVMLVAVWVRAQWRAHSVCWESTDQTANTWRALKVTSCTSGIELHWMRHAFEVPGKALAWVQRERLGFRIKEEMEARRSVTRPATSKALSTRALVAPAPKLVGPAPRRFVHYVDLPQSSHVISRRRPSLFNRLGFGYDPGKTRHEGAEDSGDFIPSDGPRSYSHSYAHVPYWALIPAFLIAGLPAVRAFIAGRRRARRLAAGCCPSCGYDVRATPERCPECGAVPVVRRAPLTARLLGRHASAVHGCVSLLMAAAIGYVFASMLHDKYETWTGVSLVVVLLGVLVKTLIGTVYERDGRRAA